MRVQSQAAPKSTNNSTLGHTILDNKIPRSSDEKSIKPKSEQNELELSKGSLSQVKNQGKDKKFETL